MPIATAAGREIAAAAFVAQANYLAAHTGDPSGGNEVAGGTYVREALTWDAGDGAGNYTATVGDINIPSGNDVTYLALWTSASGGTLLDYVYIGSNPFGADGTMAVSSVTYSEAA